MIILSVAYGREWVSVVKKSLPKDKCSCYIVRASLNHGAGRENPIIVQAARLALASFFCVVNCLCYPFNGIRSDYGYLFSMVAQAGLSSDRLGRLVLLVLTPVCVATKYHSNLLLLWCLLASIQSQIGA